MSALVSSMVTKLLTRPCTTCLLTGFSAHLRHNHWFSSVMALKTSPPLRAEPTKKKKIDPKREHQRKERMRKRLKKLEKVPPELIPIDDFIPPVRYRDESRVRSPPQLAFEESERRALLLKEWSKYKRSQHLAEMEAISQAFEAQREALEELKLESEELYFAALKPDPSFLPFHHQGPSHTPPIDNYEPPEGKYNDITKAYIQE